jgi:hypothetical protein
MHISRRSQREGAQTESLGYWNLYFDSHSDIQSFGTYHVHAPSLGSLLKPDHAIPPLTFVFRQHLRLKFYA